MTVEIITTQFIAKPEDLDRAYALYESRIAQVSTLQPDATVFAYSPKLLPSDSVFDLWFLRTQAVYDRLDAPGEWQLYELNALVEYDDSTEEVTDKVKEKFFFEDLREPTAFPGSLAGVFNMTLLREPRNSTLTYVTVGFFAAPENADVIPGLFNAFVEAADPIVYGGAPTQVDQVDMAQFAGPLWAKSAQHEIDGTNDGVPYGSKELWLGCILIDYDAEKLAQHLPESLDPDSFVLASLYPEPF